MFVPVNESSHFEFHVRAFPPNTWVTISISRLLEGDEYVYRSSDMCPQKPSYCGINHHSVVDFEPREKEDVKVYAGSIWSEPADGRIRQLRVQTKYERKFECEDSCVHHCPSGWTTIGRGCYTVKDERMSFDQAEDACRYEGGHLASVVSEEVHNFVSGAASRGFYWLGATRRLTEDGVWSWLDCSPWDYSNLVETDEEGEPKNCIRMVKGRGRRLSGKWESNFCDLPNKFVCGIRLCPTRSDCLLTVY